MQKFCGKACTMNTDCLNHPGGPACDVTTGACTAGCQRDQDCPSSQWCSAEHACTEPSPINKLTVAG